MTLMRAALRYLACLACVSALVWVCHAVFRVNATTVALAMLLLVLGVATRSGLREAIFTSIACMFGFNYFFLPPVGTLTISDPQNWVALCAFLVSAVIASQLSARAKSRAEEASARRGEIERLYQLSRALLLDDASDIARSALPRAGEIFGLRNIAFYDSDSKHIHGSLEEPFLSESELARVAASNEPATGEGRVIVPVRLGTRTIGALGFTGRELTVPERDSLANLIGISLERSRALDRATAAEAARRGEKLKTVLLDGIAHDLKTPLTAIKTCVSTLITIPPRTEAERDELLGIIDEETDRLQRTITEAVQLARIESGKVALERHVFQVSDLIERVLFPLGDRQRFLVSIPQNLTVCADAGLLEQVIKQLAENASKYSPVSKPIEINVHSENGSIFFQVLDRGLGISPNELNLIFGKYYRGVRGRNAAGGTGMGLAIAKGIVEAHGGSISAENRAGGGAVFSFQLSLE